MTDKLGGIACHGAPASRQLCRRGCPLSKAIRVDWALRRLFVLADSRSRRTTASAPAAPPADCARCTTGRWRNLPRPPVPLGAPHRIRVGATEPRLYVLAAAALSCQCVLRRLCGHEIEASRVPSSNVR